MSYTVLLLVYANLYRIRHQSRLTPWIALTTIFALYYIIVPEIFISQLSNLSLKLQYEISNGITTDVPMFVKLGSDTF
jgi:hypothetical protein